MLDLCDPKINVTAELILSKPN
uniref:Uncharacterized protein n=1 Tax=Anguilla anguilla TaxID=7936 RepID=A0A0E9VID7_ANGAN